MMTMRGRMCTPQQRLFSTFSISFSLVHCLFFFRNCRISRVDKPFYLLIVFAQDSFEPTGNREGTHGVKLTNINATGLI